MLYRLWTTRGDAEKMAQASASCDPRHVATSPAQRSELRAFVCSACGYTLFPALGREAAFFTEAFRCPACEAPKEDFLDVRSSAAAAAEEAPAALALAGGAAL
mmetsp:Transcript_82624/g.207905  ORF Transcript_82624/g.207905 Transcript_82624/m.207905 type:complete len:103 (+) Transcript_82624:1043-1351(+)